MKRRVQIFLSVVLFVGSIVGALAISQITVWDASGNSQVDAHWANWLAVAVLILGGLSPILTWRWPPTRRRIQIYASLGILCGGIAGAVAVSQIKDSVLVSSGTFLPSTGPYSMETPGWARWLALCILIVAILSPILTWPRPVILRRKVSQDPASETTRSVATPDAGTPTL